jgi:hypothetical protein
VDGNNNLGDIAGLLHILVLLKKVYARDLVAGQPPLLLFTDSLLVVGALDWGWSARDMPPPIRDLRHAYRKELLRWLGKNNGSKLGNRDHRNIFSYTPAM